MAKRGNHLLLTGVLLAFLLCTQSTSFSRYHPFNLSREHQENKVEKENPELTAATIPAKVHSKKIKKRVTHSAVLAHQPKTANYTSMFIPVKPDLIILYRTLLI